MTSKDSISSGHRTNGPTESVRRDEWPPERPVVLITGDSLDLPLELGTLLRECGCSAFATPNPRALNPAQPDPDVVVVNIADLDASDLDRVSTLRRKFRKPMVCMLPYPTEEQVARVAALGADFLVFKPLCAEDFKSRIRLLLSGWGERE
jgi:AmiR/NasT family two-component response regulator